MTEGEARGLMGVNFKKAPEVTVRRNGAEWTGRVVGLVDRPALVLQCTNGMTTVVVLDEATAYPAREGRVSTAALAAEVREAKR